MIDRKLLHDQVDNYLSYWHWFRVGDAVRWLEKFKASHIPVAAVATGFPSGQYSLTTRLEEIKYAISEGAKEIDIVINRTLALQVLKIRV